MSTRGQHLAFWTGNNCERMLTLVKQSALARDKWDSREGYYLERTIQRALSSEDTFDTGGKVVDTVAADFGAPRLRGSRDGQRAATVRQRVLYRVLHCLVRFLTGEARLVDFSMVLNAPMPIDLLQ